MLRSPGPSDDEWQIRDKQAGPVTAPHKSLLVFWRRLCTRPFHYEVQHLRAVVP